MWRNSKKNVEIQQSMFNNWSPLPERKLFTNFEEHKDVACNSNDLYSNCDIHIWLRSCEKEIIDPIEGVIIGDIPKWLKGSLLRNGPGSIKIGDTEFKHLFDSSALLHRFGIENGKVTYQCRFLESEVRKKNSSANRIVISEFGTCAVPDPCQSIFKRISSIFDKNNQSDNAMISIYPFGDEMYAFTENPIIYKINKLTLNTEEKLDVRKYVTIINHTSHPHVINNGSVYNLGMSLTTSGLYHNIVHFPIKENNESMFENAEIVAKVPARWYLHPSYMHTFGITDNYFIIVEQPLSIAVPSILITKIKNQPLISAFRWYKDEMTQFHVICRKTGKTAYKFYSEAFFFLHIINQYEIDNHIIIDICCYRDPSMIDCMFIETMRNFQNNPNYARMFKGRPMRFVLPLNTGNSEENLVKLPDTNAKAFLLSNRDIFVKSEQLCDLGCETPKINYDKYLGKKYRYFYAISSDVDCHNPGTIIKVDTWTKTCKTWCEENVYPSEPIFVPNPDSELEDDGIILSSMIWGQDHPNKVGLLILNAKTLTEIARAEFETEGPVPKCLHGWFTNIQK